MSSWPSYMLPIEEILWSAVQMSVHHLGLQKQYKRYLELYENTGMRSNHPLDVDSGFGQFFEKGSIALREFGKDLGQPISETPIAIAAEQIFLNFVHTEPGLYIWKSSQLLKVDDRVVTDVRKIPLKEDNAPILVNKRKWSDFRGKYRIFTRKQLIDMIGDLGEPGKNVTKAMARKLVLPFICDAEFERIWPLAKEKYPEWLGKTGAPKKAP